MLTRRDFLQRMSGGRACSGPEPSARQARAPAPRSGSTGRRLVLDRAACLAWGGTDCRICFAVCPLRGRALVFVGERPRLDAGGCDGCGICVDACRAANDRAALRWVRA